MGTTITMVIVVAIASTTIPATNLMTTFVVRSIIANPITTTSRLGLIDGNAPPIEGLPVHPRNVILHRLLMPEGYKSEAP